MKDALALLKAFVMSWWFAGLIGWGLIVWKYPMASILPRYAG